MAVEVEAFPLGQDGPKRDRLLLDQHGGQAAPTATREMSIPPPLAGSGRRGPCSVPRLLPENGISEA